jgi:hypothetical protein
VARIIVLKIHNGMSRDPKVKKIDISVICTERAYFSSDFDIVMNSLGKSV